jgi:hypothetical protein
MTRINIERKSMIEIKHRYSGAALYSGEHESLREAVVAAVKADADLARADLAGANLAGANLSDAYLADADLAGADLARAYLARADLAGAYLEGANLSGADLAGADLARAYLARADLADAYLEGANLSGADLAGADLARAYLARADLAGANLAGANLSDADLAGADLADARNVPERTEQADPPEPYERLPSAERYARRAARFRERNPDVPVIPDIDRQILSVIESGAGKLNMDSWHSCETTHCRAGWAITLAGEAGRKLEERYGPAIAGRMIYTASTGRTPHFFASDERALEDIRECAATQSASVPA